MKHITLHHYLIFPKPTPTNWKTPFDTMNAQDITSQRENMASLTWWIETHYISPNFSVKEIYKN